MNIFDPHISGSLSVSGSGEISGDLRVLGTISGSIKGDGSQLFNIPSSGVTGLNLTRIADGSATASISSANGLVINTNTEITGTLKLNKVNLGGNNIVNLTLTDGGGKYYINGVKSPRLSFIKGFKYRFNYNNNNTHPLLFSLTSDGEHNGGTTYTTGVTTNADPFYVEVEVTDATAATLYYWCDHHVGMGNAITVYSDFLNGQSSIGLINVDTTAFATTGSNNFTNIQRTSGSLVVTGSVDITGSITLNGQAIGTGKLDETTFQSYTSSNDSTNTTQNSRLTSIESITSSLNSFTSSIDNTIKNKLNTESVITGSVQVLITGTTGYSTFSSSISTSIGSLSGSVATTTSGLSSSIDSLSSSVATTTSGLSSSVATTTSGLSSSISSLSSSVAITTFDTKNRVDSIETSTGSLNSFTGSINTTIKSKLDTESVISGSIQVNITGTTGYSTFSSSISTSVSSLSSSIGSLSSSVATTTSGLSSSVDSLSSSIGSLSSSVATTTSGLSSSIGSLSSSVATTTLGLSSSIATTTLGTKNRVDSIEAKTGSYATTGSNVFQGNQTITGSLYISQDLIVAGSSSIQHISSSIVNISDNIITVNALNPSVRFGGLAVIDSGSSPQVSGSILFDSINNQWLFVHQNQATVTSSILLMGPETYDNLGNETYITQNRLVKSTGIEHLSDSNITDTGTKVSINSDTEVTGTLKVTGVIGSPTITAIETSTSSLNTFTSSLLTAIELTGSNLTIRGNFLVKGTTTNVNTATLDVDNNLINLNGTNATFAGLRVKDNTGPSLISGSLLWDATNDYWIAGQLGSEQRLIRETEFNNAVTRIGNVETSTGSLNSFTSSINTTIKSKLNADGVISGSIQVNHNATTNYVANQHIDHTAVSITAGSGLTGGGDISATRTINIGAGNGITVNADDIAIDTASATFTTGVKSKMNTDTVMSGSYLGTATTANLGENASYLYYTDARVKTKLNAEGVVSGSVQVSFTGTTGYSTYINQPLLTTSTPTFSTVSATTFTGALSGNATTATTAGALTSMNISQFTNNSAYLTSITSGNVTTALGFTPYNATNPSGYISSITSGNVTTALGYTPYNATNPSGFISSITSGNVTTALGFTPYNATNPSGFISGISFANVSAKPTTISGYGITDAITTGNIGSQSVNFATSATTADQIDGVGFRNTGLNSSIAANTLDSNGMTYVTDVDGASTNLTGNSADGALYSQIYSSSWQHQIYGDYRTGIMYVRGKNNNTWQSWKRVALSSSTTFSSVSSLTFTHNLGTANVTAQVFDSNGDMFFPSNIRVSSTQVIVTFASARSGRLVVTG